MRQGRRARPLDGTTRRLGRLGGAALLGVLVLLLLGHPGVAGQGAVHEVRLLHVDSKGQPFAFEPKLLRIAPGDRVRFDVVDLGHGTQSIPGMVPEGGTTWRSGIGRETEVGFEVEGVYGYLCRAHYSMGMVGLIVVGDPGANLAKAREVRHPERAHRVFEALFEALEAETAEPAVN